VFLLSILRHQEEHLFFEEAYDWKVFNCHEHRRLCLPSLHFLLGKYLMEIKDAHPPTHLLWCLQEIQVGKCLSVGQAKTKQNKTTTTTTTKTKQNKKATTKLR